MKKPDAEYLCATVDLFQTQVILCIGDRDECAKLIDSNKSPSYSGPKIGDGFRTAIEEAEKKCICPAIAYTFYVQPVVIIYAPKPITLSTLVHEISHAVDYIEDITGCDDGETRARLADFLFTNLAVKHDKVIVKPGDGK